MLSGTARCPASEQAALLLFNSVSQFSLPPAEFFCSAKGLLCAIYSPPSPSWVELHWSLSKEIGPAEWTRRTDLGVGGCSLLASFESVCAFDAHGRDGALRRYLFSAKGASSCKLAAARL